MTVSQALGLGILQGATEFLPISSSGHLVLARNLWPGLRGPQLLFDVVVHLGTVTAIALVLRHRVAALVRTAFVLPFRRGNPDRSDVTWLWLILVASVVTAAIGLGLRDRVEAIHTRPAVVGGALLVTAGMLVGADRLGRRSRGASDLGVWDALLVGVAQGIAVVPGISRSGATVVAALARDVDGRTAVEFSMLVSIPAILGANLLEGARAGLAGLAAEATPLVVGFLAALLTGAICLRLLQWAVTRRRLGPFAGYCVLVGLGVIGLA